MGTPSNSATTRQVRVSADTHARLSALAEDLHGSADHAIRWLLQRNDVVRVKASERQKERWSKAATAAGMPLDEFVAACTEAAVMYGTDQGTLALILQHTREVRAILRAAAQREGVDLPAQVDR